MDRLLGLAESLSLKPHDVSLDYELELNDENVFRSTEDNEMPLIGDVSAEGETVLRNYSPESLFYQAELELNGGLDVTDRTDEEGSNLLESTV